MEYLLICLFGLVALAVIGYGAVEALWRAGLWKLNRNIRRRGEREERAKVLPQEEVRHAG